MSFAHPWVLALIPLLLWLLRQRKGRGSVTVASLRLWPGKQARKARYLWLPPFLRRLTLTCLLVAFARPQAISSFDAEVTEGIAIQMLVDVSSSMDMSMQGFGDQASSRMEMAKDIVERFIDGDGADLQGRPHDLIGLITFARYADTRSPLTTGHDALVQIVRNLTIQERPNEDGTAYGDALAIAAARLKNLEELRHGSNQVDVDAIKSRVIILLTDGENNSGSHMPVEAAGLAKAWGCRIYVVSMSDSSTGNRTNEVETAPLSPAERVLQHIANETGGLFRKAGDFESLKSVYTEIDQLERSEILKRSFERVADWFWLPLCVAVTSLLLALTLEATWLRVVP